MAWDWSDGSVQCDGCRWKLRQAVWTDKQKNKVLHAAGGFINDAGTAVCPLCLLDRRVSGIQTHDPTPEGRYWNTREERLSLLREFWSGPHEPEETLDNCLGARPEGDDGQNRRAGAAAADDGWRAGCSAAGIIFDLADELDSAVPIQCMPEFSTSWTSGYPGAQTSNASATPLSHTLVQESSGREEHAGLANGPDGRTAGDWSTEQSRPADAAVATNRQAPGPRAGSDASHESNGAAPTWPDSRESDITDMRRTIQDLLSTVQQQNQLLADQQRLNSELLERSERMWRMLQHVIWRLPSPQ